MLSIKWLSSPGWETEWLWIEALELQLAMPATVVLLTITVNKAEEMKKICKNGIENYVFSFYCQYLCSSWFFIGCSVSCRYEPPYKHRRLQVRSSGQSFGQWPEFKYLLSRSFIVWSWKSHYLKAHQVMRHACEKYSSLSVSHFLIFLF